MMHGDVFVHSSYFKHKCQTYISSRSALIKAIDNAHIAHFGWNIHPDCVIVYRSGIIDIGLIFTDPYYPQAILEFALERGHTEHYTPMDNRYDPAVQAMIMGGLGP